MLYNLLKTDNGIENSLDFNKKSIIKKEYEEEGIELEDFDKILKKSKKNDEILEKNFTNIIKMESSQFNSNNLESLGKELKDFCEKSVKEINRVPIINQEKINRIMNCKTFVSNDFSENKDSYSFLINHIKSLEKMLIETNKELQFFKSASNFCLNSDEKNEIPLLSLNIK